MHDLILYINYLRGGLHAYLHTMKPGLLNQSKLLFVMIILTGQIKETDKDKAVDENSYVMVAERQNNSRSFPLWKTLFYEA